MLSVFMLAVILMRLSHCVRSGCLVALLGTSIISSSGLEFAAVELSSPASLRYCMIRNCCESSICCVAEHHVVSGHPVHCLPMQPMVPSLRSRRLILCQCSLHARCFASVRIGTCWSSCVSSYLSAFVLHWSRDAPLQQARLDCSFLDQRQLET